MNCPGSVRLIRTLPDADASNTSVYAEEGTRAHALAELCFDRGMEPIEFVGEIVEGVEIDEEMAQHVKVYTDHVRSIIRRCWADEWWTERAFSLERLNPPGPMFGTADFVGYERAVARLHVADLKYGQGVLVEVKGNKQLRYYALGALLSLDLHATPVDDIEITIVQPRALHPDGVIRSEVITVEELLDFAIELIGAANDTQKPDAPLVAGDHCKFCPASGICPARRDHALAVAQHEFAIDGNDFVPPSPDTIPIEQLAAMAKKFHILKDWMADSEAIIRTRLERGEDVPGFKLVGKRPMRRWTDEDDVEKALKQEGYATEDIYELELKSPAKVEKLLGKKQFRNAVERFVKKESSGYNVAPDTDPRPAIAPPAAIDRLLTAGDDIQPGNTQESES